MPTPAVPVEDGGRPGGHRSRRRHPATPALPGSVLDALPAPTALLDTDGTVLLLNAAWADQLAEGAGLPLEVGDDYAEAVLTARDDDDVRQLIEGLGALIEHGGAPVSVDVALGAAPVGRWVHVQAARVDESGQLVVTHTDITASVEAVRDSARRALYDHLTDLPNRVHLQELVEAELGGADGGSVAVLVLDVDEFKAVNDTLGHDTGDLLLRQVAARLARATRERDTVGRLGGDEFVVLGRDVDAEEAVQLAQRCRAVFADPFSVAGATVPLTVSVGVAVSGGERRTATDLIRDADLAKYAAKAAGRDTVTLFSGELRAAAQRRLHVTTELRDAIAAGQLVVHYQPLLHLRTRTVTGVEALVRWQHPERGLLPPAEFVPVAEASGLVDELTRWVLATVSRDAAEWDAMGLPLTAAVNISATHMGSGTLVSDVTAALASSGLRPERLVLELTETSVAEDPERAAEQFAELRVSGIEVSIDDFGSGFSCLGQIVSMPAGILKIDKSLVQGIAGSGHKQASQSAAAVETVVSLAKACGMRSVAEGVETPEQLATVAALGCTYAQGFVIARPMPAEDLPRWLGARSRRRAALAG
ncbi:diguanylate cyclase (GGDEF) domain-containing protein [Klenkia marina]|uniref:Diguanylate cyclase (GGDEF) domain-containing protein n=1 Tax=Klenkia marina TaxID=1960309 RepID=A0A1G4XB36_9ACTN|nr:EAL domain-containing protein [Klenkia marina]SCX37898.1 diguanylate cyclase (GGDEF) domain-containing protein [Klenkia marina]